MTDLGSVGKGWLMCMSPLQQGWLKITRARLLHYCVEIYCVWKDRKNSKDDTQTLSLCMLVITEKSGGN